MGSQCFQSSETFLTGELCLTGDSFYAAVQCVLSLVVLVVWPFVRKS